MNNMTGISDATVPDFIGGQLLEAAAAYDNTTKAEALLRQAQSMAPECLPVYFSLYKFYFYKRMLPQAEEATLHGLETAARQAGFTPDWTQLDAQSSDWRRVDAPQYFYLFTLKALAFIRLRLGQTEESHAILDKLHELDPLDTVGGSVIRDLAANQN